ncbi:MAG: hypothetical protein AUK55_12070 [Syntrophobacteraceae bacterium CG2_30_61_12]|nr:MAG: hypothetical protein AUK55_12070 [Syntrophobacteraceae bacterium CG2_30_61_12]
MALSEYWDRFIDFLTRYDVAAIAELIRGLKWDQVIRTPLFWAIVLPFGCWIIWKRRLRILMLLASGFLFVWLVQETLPPTGGAIPLDRLLLFVAGCVVLIGLNFYFLFIRGD